MARKIVRVRFDVVPGGKRVTYQARSPRGTYYAVGFDTLLTSGLSKPERRSLVEDALSKRMPRGRHVPS